MDPVISCSTEKKETPCFLGWYLGLFIIRSQPTFSTVSLRSPCHLQWKLHSNQRNYLQFPTREGRHFSGVLSITHSQWAVITPPLCALCTGPLSLPLGIQVITSYVHCPFLGVSSMGIRVWTRDSRSLITFFLNGNKVLLILYIAMGGGSKSRIEVGLWIHFPSLPPSVHPSSIHPNLT